MRTNALALLRMLAASWGCGCSFTPAPDGMQIVELARADKGAHGAAARNGVFAFFDGFEASSDPSVVGVDVRVVDHRGDVLLESPSAGAVRGLVLIDDAVATLELSSTIADQHVVVRWFAGDTISMSHRHTPLALAAIANELVWVEARAAAWEDADGDGVKDTAVFDLTLVEADARGNVMSRVPVRVPGGVRVSPWGVLSFPHAFGLRVEADVAYFGWTHDRWSSQLFRIVRKSGEATVEWERRTRVMDSEPVELGEGLALWNGEPVVVGGVREYAAIVDSGGFLAHRGTTTYTPDPIRYAAGDGTTLIVARGKTLESFDGAFTSLALEAPDVIEGLALDESNLVMTTDQALYVLPL